MPATKENTENCYENIKVLLNYKTSKYVQSLTNTSDTVGMAINETKSLPDWMGVNYGSSTNWSAFYKHNSYPIMIRNCFFGFSVGHHYWTSPMTERTDNILKLHFYL